MKQAHDASTNTNATALPLHRMRFGFHRLARILSERSICSLAPATDVLLRLTEIRLLIMIDIVSGSLDQVRVHEVCTWKGRCSASEVDLEDDRHSQASKRTYRTSLLVPASLFCRGLHGNRVECRADPRRRHPKNLHTLNRPAQSQTWRQLTLIRFVPIYPLHFLKAFSSVGVEPGVPTGQLAR